MLVAEKGMKLKQYLMLRKVTISEFAEYIGCTRGHLSAVINGTYHPSRCLAKSIERVTDGEVKASDLLKNSDIEVRLKETIAVIPGEELPRARPDKNRENCQKKDDQQG